MFLLFCKTFLKKWSQWKKIATAFRKLKITYSSEAIRESRSPIFPHCQLIRNYQNKFQTNLKSKTKMSSIVWWWEPLMINTRSISCAENIKTKKLYQCLKQIRNQNPLTAVHNHQEKKALKWGKKPMKAKMFEFWKFKMKKAGLRIALRTKIMWVQKKT